MAYWMSPLWRSLQQNMKLVLSSRIIKCSENCRYKSYEPDGKTTISILNIDPEAGLLIDSFSQMGFRLNNGMVVIGPMAIFPKTVLSWNVPNVQGITEESLSLFFCLEPKIDLLVLGVGDGIVNQKLNINIINFVRKYKVNIETLPTEQACATFNFLNAEKRYVAGALVPPETMKVTEDDVAMTKLRVKRIYEQDD